MKKSYYLNILTILSAIMISCNEQDDLRLQSLDQGADKTQGQTRAQGDGKYESLGYGYDITGEYLDFYSIKKPVVDIDAFVKQNPSKLHNLFIGNIKTKIYGGENFLSYLHSISTESEFSASFNTNAATFSGEAKNKSTYEYSTKYSFARADIIKRHRHYEIDATPADLVPYLNKDFESDLNNLSAMRVVHKYGTHVMLDIEVGGIYKANYKSQIIEEKSIIERTRKAKAGLSATLLNIGIDVGGSSTTTEITELAKSNIAWAFQIESKGGTRNGVSLNFNSQTPIPNTTISIDSWAASVDDNHSVLVHINWRHAYYIYDFISDPVKKDEIKNAVNKYIDDAKVNMLELVPLYRVDRNDTRNTYNVYGDDELHYLLNEAPGRHHRTNDGLIGYVLKNNINMYCEPLHSIDNTKTKNTYTVIGDDQKHFYLNVLAGYKNRKYDGQTGYAYAIEMPNTLPMHRIDNRRTKNTFSVVGDKQKSYYLYQLAGYKDRSYDGQTGYIYPPDFD